MNTNILPIAAKVAKTKRNSAGNLTIYIHLHRDCRNYKLKQMSVTSKNQKDQKSKDTICKTYTQNVTLQGVGSSIKNKLLILSYPLHSCGFYRALVEIQKTDS
jgi:hypothetical protein